MDGWTDRWLSLCLFVVYQQSRHTAVWPEGPFRSGRLLRRRGPALPAGGDRHGAPHTTDVPSGTRYGELLYLNLNLACSRLNLNVFSLCPRGTLLGSHPAQLPRVQEEAVQDDCSRSGLRRGRLARTIQGRRRDGSEGDLSCRCLIFVSCLLSWRWR